MPRPGLGLAPARLWSSRLQTSLGLDPSAPRPRSPGPPCLRLCPERLSPIRYVWEKDGVTLSAEGNPRLRLDRNGSLHISQTWSGDIGTYTCRVLSAGGNDSRSAHLRVR